MKVKVDRRHLGRNLARVLDGRAIAELIKTREDKDAKQKAKTRIIHKMPPKVSTSESGYWTPIAQARVRIVVIVLLAAAAPTLSILQSLLEPLTLRTLFSTPMARVPHSESSKASEASNTPSPTKSGSQNPPIVISPPKRTLRPHRNRQNSRLHVRI